MLTRLILIVCACLVMTAHLSAQTHSVAEYGTVPAGLAQGAPTGSYSLSDLESINVFNAGLSVTLPLLKVGGRAGASHTIMLRVKKTPWTVESRLVGFGCGVEGGNSCQIWEARANTQWWTPVEPGYDPGVLQGHYVSSEPDACPDSPNSPYYSRMFTVLTFTAPDGTEHYLYDESKGGQVVERRTCANVPDSSRGRVFSSKDGSGLTFIADLEVNDDTSPDGSPPFGLFWPAGYLKTADGSVYRFVWGRAEWMRDRNGNQLTFNYVNYTPPGPGPVAGGPLANRRVTKITDSLGRVVNISYDVQDPENPQYGTHDRIEYKGFGGDPRVIRVTKKLQSEAFRLASGYQKRRMNELFQPLPLSGDAYFDPTVVSDVWLPDNTRRFRLYYNEYNELARFELPVGGAVEYDYWAGDAGGHFSGVIGTNPAPYGEPRMAVYRRLKERRQYPNGGTIYNLRTTYSREASAGEWKTSITVEQLDAANGDQLLARKKHYFHGAAGQSILGAVGSVTDGVNDPIDGKEYLTEEMPTDGVSTPLTQVQTVWEPGNTSGPRDGTTPWSAFIKETSTRLWEPSTAQFKSSKQAFTYDQYNNQTGVTVYDFGGQILSRMQTAYLTINDVNGIDYSSPAPTADGVYLRHLPEKTSVYDALDKERSRVTYEYDNYTADSTYHRHEELIPRGDISGLCAYFNVQTGVCYSPSDPNPDRRPASYVTRGNLTKTTSFLLDKEGGVLGSVSIHSQYDVAGNVVKTLDALDRPTLFSYADIFGAPDLNARNNTVPQELSDLGGLSSYAFPTLVTNAAGHTTYTQYDYYLGREVNSEDPNQVVTSARYDDLLDRLTKVERAVNATSTPSPRSQTTYTYDNESRTVTTESDLTSFEDKLLKSTTVYDGLGRAIETRAYETATQYIATLTKYDALGRVSEVANPYRPALNETQFWSKTEYDGVGRVSVLTTPDGAKTYTLYDGARTLTTDPDGKQRIRSSDALGRLTDVWEVLASTSTDPAAEAVSFPVFPGVTVPAVSKGYKTSYTYDALGNLRKVQQGLQRRYFAYDSLSRMIRAKDPEHTPSDTVINSFRLLPGLLNSLSDDNNDWSVAHVYNDDGSLKKRTDARGVSAEYTYDGLGRVKTRTYSGEAGGTTPTVTYTYDDPAVPFSKGRLTSVDNGVSTYSYTAFDELGRVTKSSQKTGGVTYSMPDYRYDLAGNLTWQQYPSGKVVRTEYDAAGRVAGVMNQATGFYYVGAAADQANRIEYAAHGAIKTMKLGNSLWEHTTFNNRLQPEKVGLGSSVSDQNKLQITYGYSPAARNNGNLRSQRIYIAGSLDLTQTYTYDDLNRLTAASEAPTGGGSAKWAQAYTYLDKFGQKAQFGNRRVDASIDPDTNQPRTSANVAPAYNPTINPQNNRFDDGQGYRYDAAGNLICEPSRDCGPAPAYVPFYGYDGDSNLKSLGGGAAAGGTTYEYDGNNRRVRKVRVNVETVVYVYDAAGRLVAEYSDYSTAGGLSYLTQDSLGSTRVVTGQDGGVKSRHDYLPFGEEIDVSRVNDSGRESIQGYNSGTVSQRFTGKERDGESGLYYFGARHYSPAQGRFLGTDIAAPDFRNPQTLNKYRYCLNNPLRHVDPDGRYEIDVHQWLTEVLALAAGFSEEDAKTIAAANQALDTNKSTNPEPNWAEFIANPGLELAESYFRRSNDHFISKELLREQWKTFEYTGSFADLGRYLHNLQDSFSHEKYGALLGQAPAGLKPDPNSPIYLKYDMEKARAADKTYTDIGRARSMAKDTFIALRVAKMSLQKAGKIRGAREAILWDGKLEDAIWAFSGSKTKQGKDEALDLIRRLVNDGVKQRREEEE